MPFLDKEGLAHLWSQIVARLNGKVEKSELDEVEASLTTAIGGKADSGHTHSIDNVTDLQTNLNLKMNMADPVGTGSFSMNRSDDPDYEIGTYSSTFGAGCIASGRSSHSEGSSAKAIGDSSHAEGYGARATGNYSHAEGRATVANGLCAHVEGDLTYAWGSAAHSEGSAPAAIPDTITNDSSKDEIVVAWDTTNASDRFAMALGTASHSEGKQCLAAGMASHAEGNLAKASGDCSHAEGQQTTASGIASHAEGYSTNASGHGAHTEGYMTSATAMYSHAEGENTIASNSGSHAEGCLTQAKGIYSHAEGQNTNAFGSGSHAEGTSTKIIPDTITSDSTDDEIVSVWGSTKFSLAKGSSSHTEGKDCLALGDNSHTEGYRTKAFGNRSHAEGYQTTASGVDSHAEGASTTASGDDSHAEGASTQAIGSGSHAEGGRTQAKGIYSHAEGYGTIANFLQHASGKYNVEKDGPADYSTQDSTNADAVFIVGCGTSSVAKNAFRISSGGKCFGAMSFGATGADFAELFEWADGNPNNEDRRGLFVALDGEKIRIANAGDDYIGVISGAQAFIGNSASEEWHDKYLTDVFGTKLSQTVEVSAEIDEETGEVIRPATTTTQYVLNPAYNSDEEYVMRENRKEWGIVGLLGQIIMIDDGTCVVGGRVAPSANGIGTASTEGYRVMKRIDENHIKVLVK